MGNGQVSFLLFCFRLSQWQHGEAIKCALQDFQANQLWVEGDFTSIISLLNADNMHDFQTNLLPQDIHVWTQVVFAFKATHVRRQGNKAADRLADQALEEQFRIIDHYSVPNVLANILYNYVHTVVDF